MTLKEKWASREVENNFLFFDFIFGVFLSIGTALGFGIAYIGVLYLLFWVIGIYYGIVRDFRNWGFAGWAYWILVSYVMYNIVPHDKSFQFLYFIFGAVSGTMGAVGFLIWKCGIDKMKEHNNRIKNRG